MLERTVRVAIIALLAGCGGPTSLLLAGIVLAGCGDEPNQRPLPEEFHDVVYGDGAFVAVGGWGPAGSNESREVRALVAVSVDGTDWDVIRLPYETPLWSIAYGNGRYVAAGSWPVFISGEACCTEREVVLFSVDGRTWTQSVGRTQFGVDHGIRSVAFSAGLFWLGLDLVSPDGESWSRAAPTPAGADTAVPGSAVMYAIGSETIPGMDDVYSSTDGTSWALECHVPELSDLGGRKPVVHEAGGSFYVGLSRGASEDLTMASEIRSGPTLCEASALQSGALLINDLFVVPGGVLVASFGGVWLGEGARLTTWTIARPSGSDRYGYTGSFYGLAASPTTVVAVGSSGFVYSRDHGRTFQPSNIARDAVDGSI